jgi:hypothetical protein
LKPLGTGKFLSWQQQHFSPLLNTEKAA